MTEFDTQEHPDFDNQGVQISASGQAKFLSQKSGLNTCSDKASFPATNSSKDTLVACKKSSKEKKEEGGGKAPHLEDIRSLTATELREKYKSEASTHDNMKTRCKKKGWPVPPDFERFADFLRIVGPKPFPSATLDRINNDKGYAPDNVRWASKEDQANNRGTSIMLTYEGETKSLASWAKELDIPYTTLKSRYDRKWSDQEIITGKQEGPRLPDFIYRLPWPEEDALDWEEGYIQEGKDCETREAFMLRYSAARYYEVKRLKANGYETAPGPNGEPVPIEMAWNYWVACNKKANALIQSAKRRDAYTHRKGGLGVRMEQQVYDWLIAAKGEIEFDPKKYTRKEYVLPTKASSYGEDDE